MLHDWDGAWLHQEQKGMGILPNSAFMAIGEYM